MVNKGYDFAFIKAKLDYLAAKRIHGEDDFEEELSEKAVENNFNRGIGADDDWVWRRDSGGNDYSLQCGDHITYMSGRKAKRMIMKRAKKTGRMMSLGYDDYGDYDDYDDIDIGHGKKKFNRETGDIEASLSSPEPDLATRVDRMEEHLRKMVELLSSGKMVSSTPVDTPRPRAPDSNVQGSSRKSFLEERAMEQALISMPAVLTPMKEAPLEEEKEEMMPKGYVKILEQTNVGVGEIGQRPINHALVSTPESTARNPVASQSLKFQEALTTVGHALIAAAPNAASKHTSKGIKKQRAELRNLIQALVDEHLNM
jgi:hypothetical protein